MGSGPRPFLHLKAANALELAHISGHDYSAQGNRVRGDQGIEWPDRFPPSLKFAPNAPVCRCGVIVKGDNLKWRA